MTHRSGRHFLQIPGPTNVPDRVLRAMDRPTIDHRGPEFAALGKRVLDGMRDVVASLIEGGLDPAAVAVQVRDAVREARPWVLTHPDWMDMVRARTERIIAEEPPSVNFLPGID